MLKVLPRKGMIPFRKIREVKPIYTGPFNISYRVGLVAVKPKPCKRTSRNYGLLGRTVEAKSNSYRESSLEIFKYYHLFTNTTLETNTN